MNKATGICGFIIFTGFLIAVWAYAKFPPPAPGEPARMIMGGVAGKVIFDHGTHAADYGLDCSACHHEMTDDTTYSCRPCHGLTADASESGMAFTDAMHGQCIPCHTEQGGPETCTTCHMTAGGARP